MGAAVRRLFPKLDAPGLDGDGVFALDPGNVFAVEDAKMNRIEFVARVVKLQAAGKLSDEGLVDIDDEAAEEEVLAAVIWLLVKEGETEVDKFKAAECSNAIFKQMVQTLNDGEKNTMLGSKAGFLGLLKVFCPVLALQFWCKRNFVKKAKEYIKEVAHEQDAGAPAGAGRMTPAYQERIDKLEKLLAAAAKLDKIKAFQRIAGLLTFEAVFDGLPARGLPPKLKKLVQRALVKQGLAYYMVALDSVKQAGGIHNARRNANRYSKETPGLVVLPLQMSAAALAHYSWGWRHCPDALGLRGLAMQLRGDYAQCINDISAALTLGQNGKRWLNEIVQRVVSDVFTRLRSGPTPPCIGCWVPVVPNAATPRRHLAAAICQVGHHLFCFGGLRPKAGAGLGNSFLAVNASAGKRTLPEERPLATLNRFDLRTRTWKRIRQRSNNSGARVLWPPARGFAVLAHHAEQNALYLWGGRLGWMSSMHPPLLDMWRFDLADRRWSRVSGLHPPVMSPGPHVMRNDNWFILEPSPSDTVRATLRRFNVNTHAWTVVDGTHAAAAAGGGGKKGRGKKKQRSKKHKKSKKKAREIAPYIAEPCAGWSQDGTLLCWSLPQNEMAKSRNSCHDVLGVWQVDLNTGKWTMHLLSGDEDDVGPGVTLLTGTPCKPRLESSACFDPVTRKAYVFGGWSNDDFDFAVLPTGRPASLTGRYFANLVEIDLDKKLIRAVESASGHKSGLGPSPRGYATIAAYTEVPSAGDEDPAHSSVVVGMGYTTFDPKKGCYTHVIPKGDMFALNLFSNDSPHVTHFPVGMKVTLPMVGDTVKIVGTSRQDLNGQTGTVQGYSSASLRFEVKLASGSSFALKKDRLELVRRGLGVHSSIFDPLSQMNPNNVKIVKFNVYTVYERARSYLVTAEDQAVRKMVSQRAPLRRGALVAPLVSDKGPVAPEDFYRSLTWRSQADLLKEFPKLEEYCPETYNYLTKGNPQTHVTIFYVAKRPDGVPECTSIGDGKMAPYMVYVGYYGRWNPNGIYVGKADGVCNPDGTISGSGPLKLSSEALKSDSGDPMKEHAAQVIQVCANPSCPSRFKPTSFRFDGTGSATSAQKLTRCSRCHIVKYCSKECQVQHWKHHKAFCKAASRGGASNK